MTRCRPKRTKVQRLQDRATIARMTLQGKTQQEIAGFLEVTQPIISLELKAIRKEWKDAAIQDFDEHRSKQLAKLQLAESELWESWQQSKLAQETTSTEKIGSLQSGDTGLTASRVKLSVRQQTRPGEVTYMNAVVATIREQNKLLGLYPTERDSSVGIHLNDSQLSVISQLIGETRNSSND